MTYIKLFKSKVQGASSSDEMVLDASLPAVFLYEHRGYKTVGHGIYELENDVKLVYEVMEKNLKISWCQRT